MKVYWQKWHIWIILFFSIFLMFITQAYSDERSSFNLPSEVTLEQFVEIISRETNTLFIYKKQSLRGELSITAPKDFKADDKEKMVILEKLLSVKGLTMIRRKGSKVVEIKPAREARFSKLPLQLDNKSKKVDSVDFVIRIYPLKYADMNKMKAVINPIFSKSGALLTYDALKLFMIIDTQANVDRITEILDTLDIDDPEGIKQTVSFYNMKYISASDANNTLNQLYATLLRSGRKQKVKILIGAQKKSLIIIANKKTTEEVKEFLTLIDVPSENGIILTIKELNYASSSKLAPLLSQIYSQKNLPAVKQAKPAPKKGKVTPALKKGKVSLNKGVGNINSSPIKIISFEALNALIIIADQGSTDEILLLIDKLDVARGDVKLILHPLQHASAKIMAPLLSNIFSDQIVAGKGKGSTATRSRVKVIPETRLNSLIIVADSLTSQRILNLINQLDVPQGEAGFIVHPLKFASAKRVANLLKSLFARPAVSGKQQGSQSQDLLIVPDEYLNAIILFGELTQKRRVIELIGQLDQPVSIEEKEPDSQFKLYRLENAVATDIAALLKDVTENIIAVAESETVKPEDDNEKKSESKQGEAPDISKKVGLVSISADESTNSLLVFAPKEIFKTLDRIIEQLDIQRVQVYIDAIIVEVSLTKSLSFGIDWTGTGVSDASDALVSGGFPNGTPVSAESAVTKAGANNLGVLGGGLLQFGDQSYFGFSAFINATQGDSDINVLANPQLLTLNNEEATINVSSVIPVATNSTVDANGRTTDQIEFRDVGIIVTIRPQISGNNSIRLDIQQTSSNVASVAVGNSNAITTLKRELKTSVVTADDTIVVLGGLLNERSTNEESGIPGLKDLPLIGWLFRTERKNLSKTNLLMFIRPTIIRNLNDLIRVTNRANNRYHEASKGNKSFKELFKEIEPVDPPKEDSSK